MLRRRMDGALLCASRFASESFGPRIGRPNPPVLPCRLLDGGSYRRLASQDGRSLSSPAKATKPRIAATYNYIDEHGSTLFEVVRFEPKDFKQRRPDGRGGWHWNLNGTRRVLYNLPTLTASESILICEGEKDCETARRFGLVATCNPGGAGKWRDDYAKFLRGKQVAIIPDLDEPGRKHARDVACSTLGVSRSVKIVELPNGKDLSEWAIPVGTGTRPTAEGLGVPPGAIPGGVLRN